MRRTRTEELSRFEMLPLSSSLKSRSLSFLLLLIALAAAAFWGGLQGRKRSQEAKAENQAIWIARFWSENSSLDDLCREAAEAAKTPILRNEWEASSGDDIALGPVVSNRRVCVRRDRSIYWRIVK